MHFSSSSDTFHGTPGKPSLWVSVSSSDKWMAYARPSSNLNDLLHDYSLYYFDQGTWYFNLLKNKKKASNQEFKPVANELSAPVMRNNPQNPKKTEVQDFPWGWILHAYNLLCLVKNKTLVTSFPPTPSKVNDFQLPFPSPVFSGVLSKLKQEYLIFSPDVLITEGPHMCTHSWIFLDIYRLQSSNCIFTLSFVVMVGRSAKAAEDGLPAQGLVQGGLEAAPLSHSSRSGSEPASQAARLQERKQTAAI